MRRTGYGSEADLGCHCDTDARKGLGTIQRSQGCNTVGTVQGLIVRLVSEQLGSGARSERG